MDKMPTQTRGYDPQLFRDAFNASPIGIVVEDLDGQPLFANPAFCAFLGFSQEELRHKHCVDFSPPEDADKDWALFQQLRAGSIDHYQLEKRYFRKDGSLVWGRLSISLLNSPPSSLVIAMVEDITEKKNSEEARFRYAAVIESSDDAIASGTLDGIIVSWNSGAQKMYGYTEAEAVGNPITMLVPSELPDEENRILETLKAGGRIEHFETVRVTKTGKRINVSLSISPIKDSSGGIVGISGIARDITERKQAEEALRVSEERLRLAQQAARIGSFERDVRTGRVTWAEGLESLYGLPPGSVHGKTTAFFNDLIHPADRERTAHLIQQALKTGQPTEGEWRAIWPDGSVHWIVSRWRVLMDDSGEPSRVVGVNLDITERKRAEEALAELNRTLEAQSALLQSSEELLKIFVKNVPAAVAMLDRDMRYLQVSDRWCTDYLPGRAQILGRSHYEIFPDMPERWKEVHRRCLEGETLRADEDRWDGQDGPHWARWEVRPWKTAEGTVGGILILSEDITRRKQMEETLSTLSRKLIDSQEQERARIGRELHDDINQRIAILAIELERLQNDPSDVQNHLQELRKQTAELSNDVEALSRELHSSKLQYLGVVSGMRSWCREFGERQNMVIDFKSDVSSVVSFDVGISLFRVLQEALHNALKHSGVKRIEVELREVFNEIHLTVTDLGRGFEIDAAIRGPGLGLTSMQERVRLLNGSIEIQSKPMLGTTIHVCVPFRSETSARREAG
jgi:PAS domain S-box-containing protein